MNYSKVVSIFLLILAGLFGNPVSIMAGNCLQCHQQQGVTPAIPPVSPLIVTDGDKTRKITLKSAFAFHGHECPGVTTAYRAVQYGIRLLFGDETPAADDLLVISRTSAAGVKDFIDLVMKGENHARRTWPPPGMEKTKGNFSFTVIRKSSCEAVDIRLQDGIWPADYFQLKKREKDGTLTAGQWDILHGYIKEIVLGFPIRPAEELFGKPGVYKLIIWGALLPGEQDRHIRVMRQAEKRRNAEKN